MCPEHARPSPRLVVCLFTRLLLSGRTMPTAPACFLRFTPIPPPKNPFVQLSDGAEDVSHDRSRDHPTGHPRQECASTGGAPHQQRDLFEAHGLHWLGRGKGLFNFDRSPRQCHGRLVCLPSIEILHPTKMFRKGVVHDSGTYIRPSIQPAFFRFNPRRNHPVRSNLIVLYLLSTSHATLASFIGNLRV